MANPLYLAKMDRLIAAGSQPGCKKSQRGVVLSTSVWPEEFWGRNRPLVGACDGSDTCRRDCSKICIHAEQDALLQAGSKARGSDVHHLKVVDGAGVVSGDPSCVECSKLMLAAGVARVWLLQENGWRSWTAAEFHQATLKNLGLHPKMPPLTWWKHRHGVYINEEYRFLNGPYIDGVAHIFHTGKGPHHRLCNGRLLDIAGEPHSFGILSHKPCPACLAKGSEVPATDNET